MKSRVFSLLIVIVVAITSAFATPSYSVAEYDVGVCSTDTYTTTVYVQDITSSDVVSATVVSTYGETSLIVLKPPVVTETAYNYNLSSRTISTNNQLDRIKNRYGKHTIRYLKADGTVKPTV